MCSQRHCFCPQLHCLIYEHQFGSCLGQGEGCILADFMGLGKTFQVICAIQTLFSLTPAARTRLRVGTTHDKPLTVSLCSYRLVRPLHAHMHTPNTQTVHPESRVVHASGFRGLVIVCGFQVLVLAPAIVVRNWEAECMKFLPTDLRHVVNASVLDASQVRYFMSRMQCLFA